MGQITACLLCISLSGVILSSASGRKSDGILCKDTTTGALKYGGKISTTRSGLTCQRWSSQYPHEHKFKEDSMFSVDKGVSGADNYCRDPDGEGMPWCYTTLHWKRWDFCDIPVCNRDCWYGDKSRLYHGTTATTESGNTCQPWSDQSPHEHSNDMSIRFPLDESVSKAKNYCRDPDGEGAPWCYTTNPEIRWEFCDVRCAE